MDHSRNNVNKKPLFTYIWTIENMSEAISSLESPTFTVNKMQLTKWNLIISTAKIFPETKKNIILGIRRATKDDGPKGIEIKLEISFLGIDGSPLIEKVGEKMFENCDLFEFTKFRGKHEVFVTRRAEFLPKDELTIRCQMWRTGTEISQTDSCFARTRLNPDRHSFIWDIRDFSTLLRHRIEKTLRIKLPKNQLTLNLAVKGNDGEEHISISLQNPVVERHTVKISLLNFEGEVNHSEEKTGHGEGAFEFENFIAKSSLIQNKELLLPNDVMLLRCEIEMDAKIVFSAIENYTFSNSKTYGALASDEAEILHLKQEESSNVSSSFTEAMQSLIAGGAFSDVTLRTGSKSFPAHKCILSARSPFFKDRFIKEMNGIKDIQQKTGDSVDIQDEGTMTQFLSYIYTDRVGELEWKRAVDLYIVADKYKVFDLKRRCATFLKSGLSASSVSAVCSVADIYRDKELIEAVQDFHMQHRAKV